MEDYRKYIIIIIALIIIKIISSNATHHTDKKNKNNNKKKGNIDGLINYIDGFRDAMFFQIIELLVSLSVNEYDSYEHFKTNTINKIENSMFIYIQKLVNEYKKTETISKYQDKKINKMVYNYIDSLIDDFNIKDKIEFIWNSYKNSPQ